MPERIEPRLSPRPAARLCGRHGIYRTAACEGCEKDGPLSLESLWFVVSEAANRREGVPIQ